MGTKSWDIYFHNLCVAIAFKSPCLSRQIGAVLVRDHSIVTTGYNGPPRGVPHCGEDRFIKDGYLVELTNEVGVPFDETERFERECPRKVLGYKSGTHMELCPAQHAERNAISNAARLGVSVLNTTLYMNCVIPCQQCFGALINAGITEIVIEKIEVYDKHTKFIIESSEIRIREFKL